MFDYSGIPVERKITYLQEHEYWENPATDLNPAGLLDYCDTMLDANAVMRKDLDAWLAENPGEGRDLTPYNGLDNRSYEQLMADVQDRNILAETIQQVDLGVGVRLPTLVGGEAIDVGLPEGLSEDLVDDTDHHISRTIEVLVNPKSLVRNVVEEVMNLLDEPLGSGTEIRICAKGFELGPKTALEVLGACHEHTDRDMLLHKDSQDKRVVIVSLPDNRKLHQVITIEMSLYTP